MKKLTITFTLLFLFFFNTAVLNANDFQDSYSDDDICFFVEEFSHNFDLGWTCDDGAEGEELLKFFREAMMDAWEEAFGWGWWEGEAYTLDNLPSNGDFTQADIDQAFLDGTNSVTIVEWQADHQGSEIQVQLSNGLITGNSEIYQSVQAEGSNGLFTQFDLDNAYQEGSLSGFSQGEISGYENGHNSVVIAEWQVDHQGSEVQVQLSNGLIFGNAIAYQEIVTENTAGLFTQFDLDNAYQEGSLSGFSQGEISGYENGHNSVVIAEWQADHQGSEIQVQLSNGRIFGSKSTYEDVFDTGSLSVTVSEVLAMNSSRLLQMTLSNGRTFNNTQQYEVIYQFAQAGFNVPNDSEFFVIGPTRIIKRSDWITSGDFFKEFFTAIDLNDGDVSETLEVTKNEFRGNASTPGNYNMEISFENSNGDTIKHTFVIEVKEMRPLVVLDNTSFIVPNNKLISTEEWVTILKDLDLLARGSFIISNMDDEYSDNYSEVGTHQKSFRLTSSAGDDIDFDLTIDVVVLNQSLIGISSSAFNTFLQLSIQFWWIYLLASIGLIGFIQTKKGA